MVIEERSVQAGAIRRATMLGRDSRAECEAVRRRKFPRCDRVQHDSDVRRAAEEIGARFCFRCGSVCTMDANPGFDEWTNQPRPDRALMVNGISLRASRLGSRGA